jgi:3D (Asp-Asp-Asp) domain-containing protein
MNIIRLTAISVFLASASTGCNLPAVKTILKKDDRQTPSNGADRTNPQPAPSPQQPDSSPHWIEISSSYDTFFKAEPVDSTQLSREEKCPLPRGTRHNLAKAPEWQGSHMRIELKKPMVACGITSGWVYAPHVGQSSDSQLGPVKSTHRSTATLYTTENTAIEGGPKDRCGRPLRTLEDYLKGNAEFVSLAMDRSTLEYGTLVRIPEIEKYFGLSQPIPFKVVDTGSAFIGKGFSRFDICVGHSQEAIYSDKFIWMSHKTFDFQVIQRGASFDCG